MQVEKIRIIAKDLGVQDLCIELMYAQKKRDGHYAFSKKGTLRDREEYEPIVAELKKKMSAVLLVRIPEFQGWPWSIGRLDENVYYVAVWNPDWLPAKDQVSGE